MPEDTEEAATPAPDTSEVDDQLAALLAEKDLLQEEKDRLAEENAALNDENKALTVAAEASEPTFEDWKDEEWKNPRARPVSKVGDWATKEWKAERFGAKKMVVLTGKKGRGTKKFFWNRDPTKLVIKEIDLDEVVSLHVKGGPARLVFGDVVELTPDLIQRLRPYIVDGSLGPRRSNPVRRSIKTGMVVVDEEPA